MAFLRLADYHNDIETVAFPKIYTSFKSLLETKDRCIKIKGRISERNGEKSIIIEAVKELEPKAS
jgi:DNA polymerase III alpha subunit